VPVTSAGEGGKSAPGFHLVQAGETLYSIAWRYGMDYRELASTNQIGPPFTIYVNQKLSLLKRSNRKSSKPGKIQSAPKAATVKPAKPKRDAVASQAANIKWSWPVRGPVIRRFSPQKGLNKGIDIKSRLGQPVSSAADGIVVYAGGGLRGFGKLIIVKHTQDYLSAYGHNRALLVKEGEKVKGGQHVAEIGSNGSNEEMLHFEIRRNGKPENPLRYLPKL
jgi:lipoprotein NlpD|tara:strand:+ start:85352 stop:86014 length:663 start_codon:yes stop_codon:yes gene_type:complete